jgi:cytidylate kinase
VPQAKRRWPAQALLAARLSLGAYAMSASGAVGTTPYVRVRASRDGGEFIFPAEVLTGLSSTAKGMLAGNVFAESRGVVHVPAAGLRGGGEADDKPGEALSRCAPVVVAVDGPAASGKGTIGKRLARELRLAHLDTGALYRATALRMIRQGLVGASGLVEPGADGTVLRAAEEALSVTEQDLQDKELREERVGQCASIVSADPSVRQALLDYQRNFCTSPPAGSRGAVLDGRDIGTVIYPQAPVKLFITADPAIRAYRRHRELGASGAGPSLEQVMRDMQQRDLRDSTRAGVCLCLSSVALQAGHRATRGRGLWCALACGRAVAFRLAVATATRALFEMFS